MFRFPVVYGPRQPLPLEWCVVRRVLDGRRAIVLADGGLTLSTMGYVENLAHAVLLAVDRPDASAGQSYNVGDERTLTVRQRVESIARIMGHESRSSECPRKWRGRRGRCSRTRRATTG
jgi:nucleoside-diphosphate-sugar epimerase